MAKKRQIDWDSANWNLTNAQIGRILGCGKDTARRWRPAGRLSYESAAKVENKRIVAKIDWSAYAGMSPNKMAEALGVPRSALLRAHAIHAVRAGSVA